MANQAILEYISSTNQTAYTSSKKARSWYLVTTGIVSTGGHWAMGKVVALERDSPHNHASMKCMSCGHKWEAVSPSPCPMVYFECPECGCDGGMKQGMCEPESHNGVWVCNCGCSVFEIYRGAGAFCINCGTVQNW